MFNAFSIVREVAGIVAGATAKVPAIENRFHISERLDGDWPEGPFLWLHGASLGECRMLMTLAGFLQQDLPDCPKILITTQKPEVVHFLKNSDKDIEAALAPADTPTSLAKFISKVKPIGLVLGENELWPGYLSAMRRLSLKPSVAIVSGRFHRALPFLDYSSVGFAAMQTGADSNRIQSAFDGTCPAKAFIGGDWKLLSWAKSGKEVTVPENPSVDTAFLSMHFAEWASLSRMIISSIKHQESVVLVPRRLEEVETFRKALLEQELIVTEWPLVQKGAVALVTKFGLSGRLLQPDPRGPRLLGTSPERRCHLRRSLLQRAKGNRLHPGPRRSADTAPDHRRLCRPEQGRHPDGQVLPGTGTAENYGIIPATCRILERPAQSTRLKT